MIYIIKTFFILNELLLMNNSLTGTVLSLIILHPLWVENTRQTD
jgi:hypothetical protein